MPGTHSRQIPSYRLHKPSGLAVVRIDGRDIYLGRHGVPESKMAYERVIAEWLGNHHTVPSADAEGFTDQTVDQIFLAYWEHAQGYYRKNGQPTSQIAQIKLAAQPLSKLYGTSPASKFGPLALKAVRQQFIERDLSLTTVNDAVGIVKRIFKWAVENELVPPSVYHGLQAVSGLRRGRTSVRVSEPVSPVGEQVVRSIFPFVGPQVQAMIELQLLTGMRPGEVVIMRGRDLDTTGKVWVYKPASHKTEHHGRDRVIWLGPRAQEIVKPWLRPDLAAFLFSPAEAVAAQNRQRRMGRKSPMTPSQASRRPKPNPQWAPKDHYTESSYRRAIRRACEAVFPAPDGLEKRESVKWRRDHRWAPNRLRHNAATFLRKQYGLDAARVILGHSSPAVTEVYAELDHEKAMQIMAQVG